jgi:hypothetical protein
MLGDYRRVRPMIGCTQYDINEGLQAGGMGLSAADWL